MVPQTSSFGTKIYPAVFLFGQFYDPELPAWLLELWGISFFAYFAVCIIKMFNFLSELIKLSQIWICYTKRTFPCLPSWWWDSLIFAPQYLGLVSGEIACYHLRYWTAGDALNKTWWSLSGRGTCHFIDGSWLHCWWDATNMWALWHTRYSI